MEQRIYGIFTFLIISLISIASGATDTVIHQINNETFICYPPDIIPEKSPTDVRVFTDGGKDSCECKENYCECCEYDIKRICVKVQYYKVMDIPAAFGLTVTYNYDIVLDVVVNATNLPCIGLPIAKDFMNLCLKLYNFNDHRDYVGVCIMLKGSFFFTKFKVPLGCVNIPKHINYANEFIPIAGGKDLRLDKYQYSTYNGSRLNTTSSGSQIIMNCYVVLIFMGLLVFHKFHLHS